MNSTNMNGALQYTRFPAVYNYKSTKIKYLLLLKLSNESVAHQISQTKKRSYEKQFVDFVYI